jgi:hypothetical protein
MQKHITKFLILTIILTAALSVNYLFAAWTGPTQAPPGGNTSTPVHVGSTNQVKDGGLSLDALSVFGGGYFQGDVGVGVVTPKQKLDIEGGIEVGNTTTETAGTIRWTGVDFEGYDGSAWVSLTGEEVVVPPLASADCDAAGGSWEGGQEICYFSGTSCSSGWTRKNSYGSTSSNVCSHAGIVGGSGSCSGGSCITASHFRSSSGTESCSYSYGTLLGGRGGCGKTSLTCHANLTEVGCTKN